MLSTEGVSGSPPAVLHLLMAFIYNQGLGEYCPESLLTIIEEEDTRGRLCPPCPGAQAGWVQGEGSRGCQWPCGGDLGCLCLGEEDLGCWHGVPML